jgi:hypothetical protein
MYAIDAGASYLVPVPMLNRYCCLQLEVADKVADAIQKTYGTTWRRGNSCATLCEYIDSE